MASTLSSACPRILRATAVAVGRSRAAISTSRVSETNAFLAFKL